jgi:phage-related protein
VCAAVLPLSEVVAAEMPDNLRARWEALQSALAPDSFYGLNQLQRLYNNTAADAGGNNSEENSSAELKNWINLVNYSSIIGSIKQVNNI